MPDDQDVETTPLKQQQEDNGGVNPQIVPATTEIVEDTEDTPLQQTKINIPITGGFVKPKPHEPWKLKYKRTLKMFIPWSRTPKEGNQLPLETTGCLNYFSVSWMTGKMWKGLRHGLAMKDLFEMPTREQSKENAERLQRLWEKELEMSKKENRESSFSRSAWAFCKTRVIVATVLLSFSIIMQFLAPSLVLKMILDHVNDPEQTEEDGWYLLLLLAAILFLRLMTFTLNFNVGINSALRLSGATQYLGFSKLLRVASPNDNALGQLVTFCTGGQERITEAVAVSVLFVGTPIMFVLSSVYSWYLVGPMSLLGLAIVLLFYPLMGGVAALTAILRRRVVKHTDKRVSLMNEMINSIRLIKMYAWEKPFCERIKKIRHDEMKALWKTAALQSISFSVTPCITVIAAIVTMIALTSSQSFDLTASVAFTVFSVFTALQFSVATLPIAFRVVTEAKVSLDRLRKFLLLPEYSYPTLIEKKEEEVALKIDKLNAAWEAGPEDSKAKKSGDKDEKEKKSKNQKQDDEAKYVQCLYDVNLTVDKGHLVGVAGPVGAGKSSLISAIMGEMKVMDGSNLSVFSKLALVPQQAWIFSGTVQDNILFGAAYDETRFNAVVDSAALKPDLAGWPSGQLTEVGERGLTLSGGQKQRICLARALYAVLDDDDSDSHYLVLLDDPLSAVDAAVAQHIFEKAIVKLLKGHTVLLVTHAMQFLNRCDRVAFMKNGTVAEYGTYQDLMDAGKDFVSMVSFDQTNKKMTSDLYKGGEVEKNPTIKRLRSRTMSVSSEKEDELIGQQLIMAEEFDGYDAGWSVILKYIKACGGYFIMLTVFMLVVVFVLVRLFTSIWLQIWIDAGDGLSEERLANMTSSGLNVTLSDDVLLGNISDNPKLWMYQLIYGMSLVVLVLLGLTKGFALAIQFLKGSSRLHDQMLQRVMRCPMSFFDSTPAGRVINRFSKDMDEMDVRMPYYTEFVTQSMLMCLTQIGVVCIVYPLFIVATIVIIGIFCFFDIFMNRGVLETRKLDNKTKSPVLQALSTVMVGIPVIRGFQRQAVFQKKFDADLNRNIAAQLMFRYANRWYGFRMDLLGVLTILTTAAVVILNKGQVSAAQAGLALANIFQTATFVPFVMRLKADFRARFNSVERVCEYAMDLEQEAPDEDTKEMTPLPNGWPSKGVLELDSMCFRYRPNLPMVLRDISVKIEAGEKVGVVGRTGAGKTSLFAAVLRLTEVHLGRILIDGVDVSKIKLTDLRSAVAVIPQDPVLFQGTIRYNLDPFDQYEDEAIWAAVKKSHLQDKISEGNTGLSMAVENDGDNLSVGEKQLLCLARALLRQNKILLLDEATASVDVETDYKIQSTIREAFAECTVVTIAHRIHTVSNYDKIIVMKKGEVIELGKPEELLSKPDGAYRAMIKATQMSE